MRRAVVLAAVVLAPAAARANSLDAPAPPTLPALSHPGQDLAAEWMAVGVVPNADVARGAAIAWSSNFRYEAALQSRRWFFGIGGGTAGSFVEGIGSRVFVGSPEVHARGLWSSLIGLSAGGGLGIVVPVPRNLDAASEELLRVVRTVRPWDSPQYADLTLTFRPFLDARYTVGPVLFQLRQGLDWSIDLAKGDPTADLTSRTTLYVAVHLERRVSFGVEMWEVYELTALDRTGSPLPDDKRAAFALSPNVRLLGIGGVEPALSVLFPVATPLRGEVDGFFAVRLDAVFRWGTR